MECVSLLNEFTNMRTKSTEFRGLAHGYISLGRIFSAVIVKELKAAARKVMIGVSRVGRPCL